MGMQEGMVQLCVHTVTLSLPGQELPPQQSAMTKIGSITVRSTSSEKLGIVFETDAASGGVAYLSHAAEAGHEVGGRLETGMVLVAVQDICVEGLGARQVRKTLSWPRSWANLSLLWLHSHRNAWAKLPYFGPT